MRIEIKKMVVQAGIGIAQETVVAEGEGLDVIKAYVDKKQRAGASRNTAQAVREFTSALALIQPPTAVLPGAR